MLISANFKPKMGLSINCFLNKPKVNENILVGKKAKLIVIARYFGFEYFVIVELIIGVM